MKKLIIRPHIELIHFNNQTPSTWRKTQRLTCKSQWFNKSRVYELISSHALYCNCNNINNWTVPRAPSHPIESGINAYLQFDIHWHTFNSVLITVENYLSTLEPAINGAVLGGWIGAVVYKWGAIEIERWRLNCIHYPELSLNWFVTYTHVRASFWR